MEFHPFLTILHLSISSFPNNSSFKQQSSMPHRSFLSLPPLLSLLLFSSVFNSTDADTVAVYWGQDGNEGSLADTCSSGNYGIVNICFLVVFGNNRTPELNLASHCDPSSGGCRGLSDDIRECQKRGIKVLLSIGGSAGNYSLTSSDDAR